MARLVFSLFITFSYFLSCKSKEGSKLQYYPIGLYLDQELRLIDSLHPVITYYNSDSNKTKIELISFTNFKKIVDELLLDKLSRPDALNSYEEKTIHDLQLNFININYSSMESDINSIDVHINPLNDKVRSLYVNKDESKGIIKITKKILWTSEKQLLINTIYKKKEGISNKTERYNWSLMNAK